MSPYFNPRLYIDFLFVCYFLLILLWKLVKNNFKSLKSPPWLLDFLIVSVRHHYQKSLRNDYACLDLCMYAYYGCHLTGQWFHTLHFYLE